MEGSHSALDNLTNMSDSRIVEDGPPHEDEVDAPSRPLSEVKAELFKALGHPARVRILEVLASGERTVSDIQPLVGIESSHLSQQLGVLRRAGVVTNRKDGSSVIYSLSDPVVAELLDVAKRLLRTRLDSTRELLEDLNDPATVATAGEAAPR